VSVCQGSNQPPSRRLIERSIHTYICAEALLRKRQVRTCSVCGLARGEKIVSDIECSPRHTGDRNLWLLGQVDLQELTRVGTGEIVLAPDRVRGLATGLGGKDSIRSRGRDAA
jgi:hypothetical protein